MCVYVGITLKIYTLNKFQVYNTVLLTIVTMLYFRFPKFILFIYFCLRQSLIFSPGESAVECSSVTLAFCNLCHLGSSSSYGSASRVAGPRLTHHHAWLIFYILAEMVFHHVVQDSLSLPHDRPASASQPLGLQV